MHPQKQLLAENLGLLKNEFNSAIVLFDDMQGFDTGKFTVEEFNTGVATEAEEFLGKLEEKYIKIFNAVNKKKDNLIVTLQQGETGKEDYLKFYDDYYNDFLADIVKKTSEKNKMIRVGSHLVQNYEPIYHVAADGHNFSLRAPFFAPSKFIFGKEIDTLYFNLIIIWILSIIFYITLYYDILRKIISMGGRKYRKEKISV